MLLHPPLKQIPNGYVTDHLFSFFITESSGSMTRLHHRQKFNQISGELIFFILDVLLHWSSLQIPTLTIYLTICINQNIYFLFFITIY